MHKYRLVHVCYAHCGLFYKGVTFVRAVTWREIWSPRFLLKNWCFKNMSSTALYQRFIINIFLNLWALIMTLWMAYSFLWIQLLADIYEAPFHKRLIGGVIVFDEPISKNCSCMAWLRLTVMYPSFVQLPFHRHPETTGQRRVKPTSHQRLWRHWQR